MTPVLAAIDVGTNSFHLVVARPTGGPGFDTITWEKELPAPSPSPFNA